jgi:hypothetical protein
MKRAEFQMQTNKANEEAQAMSRITQAEQEKRVLIEQARQKEEQAKVMVLVAEQEMLKVKAEAEGGSLAALLTITNESKGVEVEAMAQANRIRRCGACTSYTARTSCLTLQ